MTYKRGRLVAGHLCAADYALGLLCTWTFMHLDFYAPRLLGARGKKKYFLHKSIFCKKYFFHKKVFFPKKVFFRRKFSFQTIFLIFNFKNVFFFQIKDLKKKNVKLSSLSFHLSAFEVTCIKTCNPALCRQKQFVLNLNVVHK